MCSVSAVHAARRDRALHKENQAVVITSGFTPGASYRQRQGKSTSNRTGLVIGGLSSSRVAPRRAPGGACVAVATCLLKSNPGWDALNVTLVSGFVKLILTL